MPKIIEYFGLVFYFYSHEHLPIHVHVRYAEYESVVELFFESGELKSMDVRHARGIEPLPAKQLKEAKKVIESQAIFIANSWSSYFVLGKDPETKKITKKL